MAVLKHLHWYRTEGGGSNLLNVRAAYDKLQRFESDNIEKAFKFVFTRLHFNPADSEFIPGKVQRWQMYLAFILMPKGDQLHILCQ